MKGKNFSCNNSRGMRKKSDFYETPYSMTQQFLNREKRYLPNKIFEPCCGGKAIVKVLMNNGFRVVAKDITTGDDFLLETKSYPAIVTNPPFSLAYEFIQQAKGLTEYFAFLLPLSYLHGKQRFDNVYRDKCFPLSRVHVFTRYPMLGDALRTDGKYRTGMMVYAWFVWDKRSVGSRPTIGWLDNNRYIVSSRDLI